MLRSPSLPSLPLRTALMLSALLLASPAVARAQASDGADEPSSEVAATIDPSDATEPEAGAGVDEAPTDADTADADTADAGPPAEAEGTGAAPYDPTIDGTDDGSGITMAEEAADLDHEYQVGIRVGAGLPFFFGIKYGNGPPCGPDPAATFCFFGGAGFVDIDLSFGVTPDLEITTLGRIGMVGTSPTDQNTLQFALGIRNYLPADSLFKLFLGVRAFIDVTQAGAIANWGTVDFGVRGEVGLQIDIVRYFGIYLQVGVNIAFLRAFGISPDGSGGVQVRFP